jgi:sulfite dehydrogenase (quinone) subunit SoeC
MRPPWSMIFFTTIAGTAQGLLLVLVGIDFASRWGQVAVPERLFTTGAMIVLALSATGLVAATFHLGQPMRAWRAMAMWRQSWLSREVIVLPVFMAVVALWGVAHHQERDAGLIGVAAAALALLLYLCTGMIYAAVKAIRAWATPLTPASFALTGMASGALLATASSAWLAPALVPVLGGFTALMLLLAAGLRAAALWRSLTLPAKTTLQTALGVRHPRIRQISQGAMGGGFNTREFFHGQAARRVQQVRWAAAVLGFGLPAAVLALGATGAVGLWILWLLQWPGLWADRWSFFAEGEHTQNLYHRAVG